MAILKIQAPEIFDLLMEILHNCLSVITHMFPDPPTGSGPVGQNSPCPTRPHPEEAKIIPILGGFVPWIPKYKAGDKAENYNHSEY